MKCELKEVNIADLVPAPWNPREEITEESVRSLADDIAKRGLLHNIGVWNDAESGRLVIAYGHRRVAAMRLAGIGTAIAMIYGDCTELQVRDMTRRENEYRIGIDPIKDSELLGSMRDKGLTEQELAAHYCVPLSTVCRRLKLVDLAPAVREMIGSGVKITTDALEQLSAYPVEIQEKAVKENIHDWNKDGQFAWSSFSGTVRSVIRDLDAGEKFDDCVSCPLRTGASPDLFGEVDEHALGQCLNPECYGRHMKERTRKRVAEAVDPSVRERVKLSYLWQVCEKAKKDRPDDKNPCAYWCEENTGRIIVKYGPSNEERKKREKIEKERQAKKDEERSKILKAKGECAKKMHAWFKKNFRKCAESYVGKNTVRIFDLVFAFSISCDLYAYRTKGLSKWKKNRTFDVWWDVVGKNFLSNCIDWKFSNESLCRDIITFFDDVKWDDVFTKEELSLIKKEFK